MVQFVHQKRLFFYLNFICCILFPQNEGRRSFKIDNDDEPHTSRKDEVDRGVLLFKPMVSEPIHIHRKSPLPRSRKMATNEVSACVRACFPQRKLTILIKQKRKYRFNYGASHNF